MPGSTGSEREASKCDDAIVQSPDRPGGRRAADARELSRDALRPACDPDLGEELLTLLRETDLNADGFQRGVKSLAGKHGPAAYAELVHLLAHLDFDPERARRHWRNVRRRWKRMRRELSFPVDLRVAMLSYFLDAQRSLEMPKVIELEQFGATRACAYRDEVSGLFNYRFMAEFLRREVVRGEREGAPVSFVMLDADKFKRYNDAFGHEEGNEALLAIAQALTDSIRTTDLAARYGGEEFALVLPATPKTGARLVAERVRQTVERYFRSAGKDGKPALTVSAGVATSPGDSRDPGELIRCADRALYVAKAHGRNRVELYEQGTRSFRRVSTELEGRCRGLSQEFESITTISLSEGGLAFRADRSLDVGSLMDVTLCLADAGRDVEIFARTVASSERHPGDFEIAATIVHVDNDDRRRLNNYLREVIAG